MNCGIEVEANDLIILLNERIIHETNQIKELLQYNDKMKFDKFDKENQETTTEDPEKESTPSPEL